MAIPDVCHLRGPVAMIDHPGAGGVRRAVDRRGASGTTSWTSRQPHRLILATFVDYTLQSRPPHVIALQTFEISLGGGFRYLMESVEAGDGAADRSSPPVGGVGKRHFDRILRHAGNDHRFLPSLDH